MMLELYMNKNETEKWLLQHGITAYTLHDDLTVDVDARVNLSGRSLTSIPIQFGFVRGGFDCSNNKLTSLKGCPNTVGGGFNCNNNLLTSLEFGPQKVSFEYDCSNNKLKDLIHSPSGFEGSFYCISNELETLSGSPFNLFGRFDCSRNKLTTLENGPTIVSIEYICSNNPLESFNLFDTIVPSVVQYSHDDNILIPGFEEFYVKQDNGIYALQITAKEIKSTLLKIELNKQLKEKNTTHKKMKI